MRGCNEDRLNQNKMISVAMKTAEGFVKSLNENVCPQNKSTTGINVMNDHQTITVLMKHSQFRRIDAYTETCMA